MKGKVELSLRLSQVDPAAAKKERRRAGKKRERGGKEEAAATSKGRRKAAKLESTSDGDSVDSRYDRGWL